MSYRIFLAHPKDYADLESLRRSLDDVLRARGATDYNIITGSEDFEKSFARYGGWDGWTTSVSKGTEYHDGQIAPRFNAFVVGPDRTVGKATANIIRGAISMGKPVWFFNGTLLSTVRGVACISGNFKDGWEVY